MNKYFNCSSPGFEACSVPYSCCQKEVMYKYDSEVINTRCGADTLQPILSVSSFYWNALELPLHALH